jgi:hypothetical protein
MPRLTGMGPEDPLRAICESFAHPQDFELGTQSHVLQIYANHPQPQRGAHLEGFR